MVANPQVQEAAVIGIPHPKWTERPLLYVVSKGKTMNFIPCEGGLSHNEAEAVTIGQAEQGANVLLHSILGVAGS